MFIIDCLRFLITRVTVNQLLIIKQIYIFKLERQQCKVK